MKKNKCYRILDGDGEDAAIVFDANIAIDVVSLANKMLRCGDYHYDILHYCKMMGRWGWRYMSYIER
jgi:hypothetical protein